MVRLSNTVIGVINTITLLLSLSILAFGIYLAHSSATECERFIDQPLFIIGLILLLVSLAGMVGAWCHVSLLLWAYLLFMFLLIVALLCFTVFAFVVTNKGAGRVVSRRGFREYRLGDYSHWLQTRVMDGNNWRKLRSCLVESHVCRRLADRNGSVDKLFREFRLSPLQSGCCKPPSECGFTYMTPTTWNTTAAAATATATSFNNTDCNVWKNDQSILCYDCESCRAGILANIRHDWKKLAIVNIFFLIFLVVVYSIGFCAFRNDGFKQRE